MSCHILALKGPLDAHATASVCSWMHHALTSAKSAASTPLCPATEVGVLLCVWPYGHHICNCSSSSLSCMQVDVPSPSDVLKRGRNAVALLTLPDQGQARCSQFLSNLHRVGYPLHYSIPDDCCRPDLHISFGCRRYASSGALALTATLCSSVEHTCSRQTP